MSTAVSRLRPLWVQSMSLLREAASLPDFFSLMRARLSLSKVGPLVCRTPTTVHARVASLGGEVHLRTHSTDISVLSELLASHCYQPVLEELKKAPATIVDLGANTGLAGRWLLAKFPKSRLIAVEPVPDNVDCLRRNLGAVGASATVVPACVGSEARQTRMRTDHGYWAFRMVGDNEADEPGDIRVDVVELGELLARLNIQSVDLLKCDIEGGEAELFSACSGWIRKVRVAVIECHNGFGSRELLEAIKRCGGNFTIRHLSADPAHGHEVVVIANLDAQ